jgi:3-deoxy-7-phosphoheptulonate synthase
MLESNLLPGSQPVAALSELAYGVSITDACMGWEQTERALKWAHAQLSS